jgi:hypothetical protein
MRDEIKEGIFLHMLSSLIPHPCSSALAPVWHRVQTLTASLLYGSILLRLNKEQT